MPKTKEGEKITWKEFMSRWKKGIEGITDEQRLKAQLSGINIQMLGVFFGLIVTGLALESLWWVFIILVGAFTVVLTQRLGVKQQLNLLKKLREQSDEMTLEDALNGA